MVEIPYSVWSRSLIWPTTTYTWVFVRVYNLIERFVQHNHNINIVVHGRTACALQLIWAHKQQQQINKIITQKDCKNLISNSQRRRRRRCSHSNRKDYHCDFTSHFNCKTICYRFYSNNNLPSLRLVRPNKNEKTHTHKQ